MGLLDMCCPKKPKKSLDYIIKWVENADKRFEDIDTYLENLNTALGEKQDTLTFDTTPTANSTNPVTSSGIKAALDEKADQVHMHSAIGDENSSITVGDGEINIELSDHVTHSGGEVNITVSKLPNLQRAINNPDSTPIADSNNLVTSGGVKAALDGKANSSHTHNVSDISGLPFTGLHFFVMDSIYYYIDMDELFTPEGYQTMVSGTKSVIVENSTGSVVDLGALFTSQRSIPIHTNQDLYNTTIESGGYALCTIYLVDKLEGVHEHTDSDFCYFIVLEQIFTD